MNPLAELSAILGLDLAGVERQGTYWALATRDGRRIVFRDDRAARNSGELFWTLCRAGKRHPPRLDPAMAGRAFRLMRTIAGDDEGRQACQTS